MLLVVLTLTVAGLQLVPTVAAPPTSRGPGVTVSPVPEPSATATPSTDADSTLMDNPIYRLQVSGSCPRISTPQSRTAYEQQVDGLLGCLATIFRPLVEQAHGTFGKVRHTYFGSAVDTPCGRESGAYAFYCEANATIYLSQAVYDGARYGRLSVSDTVIHEYGHHVQAMMGVFDAAEHLSEARAVTVRREELQVFCWTYYVFASVPTFDLTDSDRTFFLDIWSNTQDAEGHGTVKAQQYWGARGLQGGNLGACNTWSVTKDQVR